MSSKPLSPFSFVSPHPSLFTSSALHCPPSVQLDMELEAWNLKRFQQILGDRDSVRFPTPLFPFVTKRVLVETFEVSKLSVR